MSTYVYLRLSVAPEDVADFEADLKEMEDLSRQQPGFISTETLTAVGDEPTWVVLSEWETREQSHDWEHELHHQEVIDKWEDRYTHPYVKRRFTSE